MHAQRAEEIQGRGAAGLILEGILLAPLSNNAAGGT